MGEGYPRGVLDQNTFDLASRPGILCMEELKKHRIGISLSKDGTELSFNQVTEGTPVHYQEMDFSKVKKLVFEGIPLENETINPIQDYLLSRTRPFNVRDIQEVEFKEYSDKWCLNYYKAIRSLASAVETFTTDGNITAQGLMLVIEAVDPSHEDSALLTLNLVDKEGWGDGLRQIVDCLEKERYYNIKFNFTR